MNIENFEKWAKEHPYFNGATLDRIDSDGDYSPDNYRWATMKEQGNNRRNTILVTWNGETHSSNGDIAIPIIDIEHAPTVLEAEVE